MSINQTRRTLYRSAAFLGDVQAVRKGPKAVGRRWVRKFVWKTLSAAMRTK